MAHLLIIGGSDAGISAALRARQVAPSMDVTVVVADHFPNYSICGLPFYLSGEVPDWHDLAHRSAQEIEACGVRLLLDHVARRINPARKTVQVVSEGGNTTELQYDKLVIATGAVPVRPNIEGLDRPGVFFLRTMADAFAVHGHLSTRGARSAIVVGGGYVGLEMADALTRRGLTVTVVERGAAVLKTVDSSLGELVTAELRRNGVEVVAGAAVHTIVQDGAALAVKGEGFEAKRQVVIIGVGAAPSSELAATAGVATGIKGAIKVGPRMGTNLSDVYAAGDCAETRHALLDRPTYLPLGTTAHKQGRVAGENAAGGDREFAGSLGTQVVKVFDLAIARTGLNDAEAARAGFHPLSIETTAWDHKAYYPHGRELRLRVTGDRESGRLLGAQIVGDHRSEVAKRIDVFAAAIFNRMSVDAVGDLDLSYTPPLGTPWDAAQVAAQERMQQAKDGVRPVVSEPLGEEATT
jgi:NADPH-dependent 2,4-dienoyl-CoA reductase/sulfur reductase-like enzyme